MVARHRSVPQCAGIASVTADSSWSQKSNFASDGDCPVGCVHSGEIGTVCGGKILRRACFPCEEQAIVHGRRKQRATIRLAWKGTRVRTEREWIATPPVEMKEFHPAHEIASEQSH
jgi:hypothetical protein